MFQDEDSQGRNHIFRYYIPFFGTIYRSKRIDQYDVDNFIDLSYHELILPVMIEGVGTQFIKEE
jgi:hypothetical protein